VIIEFVVGLALLQTSLMINMIDCNVCMNSLNYYFIQTHTLAHTKKHSFTFDKIKKTILTAKCIDFLAMKTTIIIFIAAV
jgi:hypothetical protein